MYEIDALRALHARDPAKAKRAFRLSLNRLEGNRERRFAFVRDAAVVGIYDAIHQVVAAYRDGDGVEPDRTKAFHWMEKAVRDGLDSFCFDLACCYRDGDGTARDIPKFRKYMTLAAEAGETEAMFKLAVTYRDPEFGEPSVERAVYWTNKMADRGAPGALIQLAKQYRDGDGVEKSDDQFLVYAERAAAASRKRWPGLGVSNKARATDWAYEDLPEALAILADARRRRGDTAAARTLDRQAAQAAADALQVAMASGANVGQLLPEIMVRILASFKTKAGAVRSGAAVPYREWLERIYRAIKQVSAHDPTALPSDLVEAIYELGIAVSKGVGGVLDQRRAERCLSEAAQGGHGRAAYLVALGRLKAGDKVEFERFIDMASKANDMDAMIAQQVAAIGLTGRRFHDATDALQALRRSVLKIRNSKHRVEVSDVSNGIAHYTDGGALSSMLSGTRADGRNAVRLSSTVYVNDPTEGQRLREFSQEGWTNPLSFLYEDIDDPDALSWQGRDFHVFIACFSLQVDSLNLWRFYGRNGTGFSIISPMAVFDAESGDGMLRGPWAKTKRTATKLALHLVRYDDEHVRQTLSELATAMKPLKDVIGSSASLDARRLRQVAIAVLGDLMYLYKDTQYADEKEVRAIEARTLGDPEIRAFRPGEKSYEKLYLETGALLFREAGSKIIIGPKVDEADSVELDLRHRLAQKGWSASCAVERSVAKYR